MSYLSRDGYINTPAFVELVRDIDKLALAEGLKPLDLYFSKKAIVRDDHPSKAKLDAAAFEKKRAQPIKPRKRAPTSGSAVRMMVLLRNYKGLDQFADYWKDYQMAVKAIERHNAKAERVIGNLKAAAAKKRDVVNAAFDKNIECFLDLAEEAGLECAIGTSMMGKTVIIKLPNGGYMSVGKADKERFIKAQESEAAAEAPASKKKPVVKAAPAGRVAKAAVGTKTGRVSAAKAAPSARPAKAAPAKTVVKKPVAKAPAGRVAKAAPKAVGRTARR